MNTRQFQLIPTYFFTVVFVGLIIQTLGVSAQPHIYPAPPQQRKIVLIHGTIHVGNGKVIPNGMIAFDRGKILAVGETVDTSGAELVDVSGMQVYPGLIAPATNLGLVEVEAVRATRDVDEVGQIIPSVRSIVAYNADSKVIPTLRSNGILLAHIVPEGGLIGPTSSVVQLDAWNWEDAAYSKDIGIQLYLPRLYPSTPEAESRALQQVNTIRQFFQQASAYYHEPVHTRRNLGFEAVKGLFDRSKILFVHADLEKEIWLTLDLARTFHFRMVIVGGADSWRVADELKKNEVAVILRPPHSLPLTPDDPVDLPYRTAALLQQAGVKFCIGEDGFWQQRNLPFEAGTAAAYGLTREQALEAVTLRAAEILGIDSLTGSLEPGKDANIVVSRGDILDMRTSKVEMAFIQGRKINLDNKQKDLLRRYVYKYGLDMDTTQIY
ncbi:MAG: amidohydrolase family protein [Thermoflavifilum aggregans]|nr:amidohydrolase family protein [Thermoflavifilum aggregans]